MKFAASREGAAAENEVEMAEKCKISVIGLGYVGLPLALEFGKTFDVVGFDLKKQRIDALRKGVDATGESSSEAIGQAVKLTFSSDENDLDGSDFFIVTVPTPVDRFKRPDLTMLRDASATAGRHLKKGAIIVYESTVYPGCTEEECVPRIEAASGMVYNRDFFCGYSPERINPGDKKHTLTKIRKITSGSTPETAEKVDRLYASIIEAGTYPVSSIAVAEAAKVIENTQRDLNIAFVNELSKIFQLLGIDTNEVLDAACTKWNFLDFRPGLVGGHCIGVDPYYLTHQAQARGYHPEVILAGRRLNDNMATFVGQRVIKLIARRGGRVNGARILVLGGTFKENCSDIRNSKVPDVVLEMEDFGCDVELFDPRIPEEEYAAEYRCRTVEKPSGKYAAIVLAVPHREFDGFDYAAYSNDDTVIYDLKGVLPRTIASERL